jgi:chromosome segregation ATPase
MKQWKEQAVAVAEQTKCLKLELDNAMNVIADLTAQLELQEEKELTMEKKTQQLEGDLARAEEEALSRRLKMLHILAQLESTHASQKELKSQLEMQHRQLTNEADGFSVDYPDGEGLKKDVCAELLTQLDLVGLRGLCYLEA